MSPSSSGPSSENKTTSSTEALPQTSADSARLTSATPDDGTGTVFQPVAPRPATDQTEYQAPPDRQEAADLSGTVAQRLGDRVMSETISRKMKAAGYELIRPIGEGTYGAVWLAEEQTTGVKVAIKFFAHGAGHRWEMLQDEVRQLAALDSAQGMVHLKDAVSDADPPYYVMSYAEGGSLAQRLENGPLPVGEALSIFEDVVQALAYVHAHGIRHCDLKPGNVLLDRLGKPLVADFGQAHLSNDATPALGTFFYMAPEQADLGHQIPDTRWDVYGLGALFFAMLTGQPPRKDLHLSGELKNTVELSSRLRRYREGIAGTQKPIAHRSVRGVDRRLAHIIDACLELDPRKRLPSAEAILAALKRRRARIRQRPLMIAGLLVPLFLILTMTAVGWVAANSQVAETKEALIKQVINNDTAAAGLGEWGMGRSFGRRLEVINDLLKANNHDWAPVVAHAAEARKGAQAGDAGQAAALAADREQLKAWLKWAGQELHLDKRDSISGLSVVDREGNMLMSVVKDKDLDWEPSPDFFESTIKRNWAWRDWFNGQGNQAEGPLYPPVTAYHISQPYKSADKDVEKVDLTVPVRVEKDGEPVAVLVGSMKLKDLTEWLHNLKLEHGQVLVLNDRGQLLMHGDDDVLVDVKDYHDRPGEYDVLTALEAAQNNPDHHSYVDPFDHRRYYAGFKTFDAYQPGADGRWAVVVQHERAEILKPVEKLAERFMIIGACALIGVLAITGGLWWGLIWLLRRQERLGHG